jgi:hypothetical protein
MPGSSSAHVDHFSTPSVDNIGGVQIKRVPAGEAPERAI